MSGCFVLVDMLVYLSDTKRPQNSIYLGSLAQVLKKF